MMNCSEIRIEFERKGGRKLGTLGVDVAKKRRRGKRGGKRTLRTRKPDLPDSWKPDLTKEILTTE
jgi:hypothetical protein